MRVTITVEIGNDAMQDYHDVTQAVWHAIGGIDGAPSLDDDLDVRDENGNTVGSVTVSA